MQTPPTLPEVKPARRPIGPQITPPTPEQQQQERDRRICRELFLVRGTLWLVIAAIISGWQNPVPIFLAPVCLLVALIMLAWPRP